MKKNILIEGMSCEHCVAHVKEALEGLEGATKVNVSLENKCASLESNNEIDDATITAAIEEEGYDVVKIEA